MKSMTFNYDEITVARSRRGKCPVCGGKSARQRTFTMTENPYNRNPDGSVRTRTEIRAALHVEADAWVPDFTHVGCR